MKSYEKIMDEISELPDGDAKIDLLEQAIQLADELQDIEKGFHARNLLVRCACFNGNPMKMLVAFSWTISVWEKNPESYASYQILWRYKWVLGALKDFPQISLEKIEELFADMKTKYLMYGGSLRSLYYYQASFYRLNGMFDRADEAYRLWMDTERGYLSCCLACEQARQVTFAISRNAYAEAIELAAPLLKGSMSCVTEPGSTYAEVIKPYIQLQQMDKALHYAELAYRFAVHHRGRYETILKVIDFQIDADLGKAKATLEKHVHFALESENPREKFQFYLVASKLMRRLATRRFKIKFPVRFEKYREDGNYDFAELRDWFLGQARKIASAFDQRNGNGFYEEQVVAAENES